MIYLWLFLGILVLLFGWTALVGAPYVPSRKQDVNQALTTLYKISRKDTLVDLGSGGGLVLREAAKLGANAVVYEINPLLFFISKFLSSKNSRIKIHFSNFWRAKLPDETTVVYIFAVGRDMKKLKKWLRTESSRRNKTIYLISLGFEINGMRPIKTMGPHYLYKF